LILGIEYFTGLRALDCSNNQLTSLIYGSNFQFELNCNNNQLTSFDFTNFNYPLFLQCENNLITSFDFSTMHFGLGLSCSNNPLTSIETGNFHRLLYLRCSNTPVTIIDISGNNGCESLICNYNNNLTTLLIKDAVNIDADMGDTWNSFIFDKNPNLNYLCVSESRLTKAQNRLNSYGYINCALSTYCDFYPGFPFYNIEGNNKYDINENGCDVTDINFPNLKFNITKGSVFGTFFSNESGTYSIPVIEGTHTITPILENPNYFSILPTNTVVTFPTQTSPFTQDFCVTANGTHPDLEITLLPVNRARPGFEASYKIIYKNKGTNTQSGSVNLIFDDAVIDLVSASPVVSSQTVNNLSWSFVDLKPFETREIIVTVNVNSPTEIPAVNIGNTLDFTTTITSSATDETPADNTFTLNQIVVGSFDPNDKTCLEGSTIPPSAVGKYVHYMIRFENKGTAEAQNVVVKDMIDTSKFDVSSLVVTQGSHSFVTRITETNKVEFIFENINLPFDDATNDGYVAFKIKTKPSLVVGDSFSNTASIYFDYNFPIVTNTATTSILQNLGTPDFEFDSYFKIYPNPVKDILNIDVKKQIELTSISIFNTLGQQILVIPNAQQIKQMDVSSLKTGNYFIKMNTNKGISNAKFIKN
jgi:hypothetical protein